MDIFKANTLCPTLIDSVKKELQKIKGDCYIVSEVSEEMKKFVHTIFGEDDYATSGYWVRAERYFSMAHKS